MSNQMTERLSVRVPAGLARQVREKSEQTGIAYSFAIRRFLEQWVEEDNGFLEDALNLIALRASGPRTLDEQTLSEMLGYIQALKAERQQ